MDLNEFMSGGMLKLKLYGLDWRYMKDEDASRFIAQTGCIVHRRKVT